MRITGYSSQQPLKTSAKKSEAGQVFSLRSSGGGKKVDDQTAVRASDAPSDILGTLLQLQERLDSSTQSLVDWSREALSSMSILQQETLRGNVTLQTLEKLLQQTEKATNLSNTNDDQDPVINDLQAQILLRLRVELAKLEQS